MKIFKRTAILMGMMMSVAAGSVLAGGVVSGGQEEARGLRIEFVGTGPGFDQVGFEKLNATIARLQADGVLVNFTVLATGFEGGYLACADLASAVPPGGIAAVIQQLQELRAAAGTDYRLIPVKTCDENANASPAPSAVPSPEPSPEPSAQPSPDLL